MPDSEHFRRLERMYAAAPFNDLFAPTLRVEEGAATVRIPVQSRLFHAAGAVHGAVYFKALDDAAFFAVNSLVEDVFVVTASFHLHLTRPVSGGEMVASGRVVHASRRLFVAEAELHDADGKQLARGSGSFMRSRVPLTPAIGYQ